MIEFIPGRELKPGQIVKVYKNLNRDCFSIMDKKSRLVYGWASFVMLKNVKFVVSKAGQARVRKQQTRNVHAFVEGEFVAAHAAFIPDAEKIYYHPYKTDFFINYETKKKIESAPFAYLAEGECFISKGGF